MLKMINRRLGEFLNVSVYYMFENFGNYTEKGDYNNNRFYLPPLAKNYSGITV